MTDSCLGGKELAGGIAHCDRFGIIGTGPRCASKARGGRSSMFDGWRSQDSARRWGFLDWLVVAAPGLTALGYG